MHIKTILNKLLFCKLLSLKHANFNKVKVVVKLEKVVAPLRISMVQLLFQNQHGAINITNY
jgi:hypothetical protein